MVVIVFGRHEGNRNQQRTNKNIYLAHPVVPLHDCNPNNEIISEQAEEQLRSTSHRKGWLGHKAVVEPWEQKISSLRTAHKGKHHRPDSF